MHGYPRVREITVDNLDALARGCAILGTGGGGSVETGLLSARRALETSGPVKVVTLDELADDDVVVPLSGIGAPTVSHEMLANEDDVVRLAAEVERIVGAPIAAVMSSEIGGNNGVEPVGWASRLGVPLVDADGMGRAFPEVQMVSMNVVGLPPNLIVLADVIGNVSVVRPVDGAWSERLARALAVASGAHSLMADYVLTAEDARDAVIHGTVSQAVALGSATVGQADPLAALTDVLSARHLVSGKVIDVERRTGGGFVRGSVVVESTGADRGRLVRIEIQNENLVVLDDGEVLASVPDLITLVDSASAQAISTEMVRYGQRVSVLAWPCDQLWRTPRGLDIAGPRAFGYDLDYVPVEEIGAVRA
ncbi:DUF917 domain-containing protein [Nocardioides sp. GY 10113]|uniref:DUF917 domain-containing protein n=1 Tax=Nocardioides sp. GY 10113 TaxID=2569761 RepID=UPI0010A7A21B|nr:DUF917 domain-containing protein [Nocardioides sp. GY 10113]TIC88621.1 DUF917 domain-containing protein [Nocardioides sp. GY 10113]